MAQLAIKGHKTRGKEVIALLEMLGGVNSNNLYGDKGYAYYIVDSDKEIKGGSYVFGDELLYHFTLEEFEEKFPYKVGDKVTLDKIPCTIKGMSWDCDDVIYYVQGVDFSKGVYSKDKDLQPYKEETMETKKITITPQFHWNEDKIELEVTNDYEIKEENGKFYAVKKQSKYPKNYVECCDVIGLHQLETPIALGYKAEIIETLQQLLVCRDAYWKIAGEQMGIGKPWEPDWLNDEQDKYVLFTHNNAICSNRYVLGHNILAFPTEEMRDDFYENFKEMIENVKELL